MPERLRSQRFKSWQDAADLALGSFTGFFGTNSSGESSILHFLLMLKQAVESSARSQVINLSDENSSVESGISADLVHNQAAKSLLRVSFSRKSLRLVYFPE